MSEPVVGILMLKTAFPRSPGDIGNPDTWPFPVRYAVVEPATVARVVNPDPPMDLLEEPFVAAGERLVAAGCAALTTSCGFLSVFQASLAARLGVPVVTSSLMQVPMVQAGLAPGRRVGVISIDAGALTPRHLAAAGVPEDVPLVGTETGAELTRVIAGDLDTLDTAAAEADVLAAGDVLRALARGRCGGPRMHQHGALRAGARGASRPRRTTSSAWSAGSTAASPREASAAADAGVTPLAPRRFGDG